MQHNEPSVLFLVNTPDLAEVHLVIGIQPRLRKGIQPLGRHHAGHGLEGRLHAAQLRQEEGRTQKPDLQTYQ